jgi:hypothetical protein
MKKKIRLGTVIFLSALHILTEAGCQKNPETNISHNHIEAKIMQDKSPNPWQDGTEVVFILANQKLIESPRIAPEGFYVRGIMENNQFKPKSAILGIGELATNGRYGWLELISKEFFPMESDRKALTPFVKGYITKTGFIPSVREVFDER